MIIGVYNMGSLGTAFASASSGSLALAGSPSSPAPDQALAGVSEVHAWLENQYQARVWSQLMHRFKATHTDKAQSLDARVNEAIAAALPHAAASIAFFIDKPEYTFEERFDRTLQVIGKLPGHQDGDAFAAYQAFLNEWGAYIV